jgi:lysophospholipase L1-like esterase
MSKFKIIFINIIIFFLLLLFTEGIAWVVLKLLTEKKAPLHQRLAYYQQQTWAEKYVMEHQKSFRFDFQPFVMSRKKPYKGNYVNIDSSSLRYTAYNSPKVGAKKVFFMGGSTIYGTGSPDSLTIPSYFTKILHQKNKDTAIVSSNFGESAWVVQQSFIQLVGELRKGNIPDYVILYDGANDMYAALQNQRANSIQNAMTYSQNIHPTYKSVLQRIWLMGKEKSYTLALVQHFIGETKFVTLTPAQEQALAQDVIANYLGTYQLIAALAKSYGFEFIMFWQPTIQTTNKKLGEQEKIILKNQDKVLTSFIKTTNKTIEKVSNEQYPNLHLLHNALDIISVDVFFDFVHITPQGNEVIAQKMIDILVTKQ